MTTETRTALQTRDTVLKLLTNEELAQVTTAETRSQLVEGDEYLDLEHLDRGVRNAHGFTTPMDRVLPRKAVQAATWSKILAELPPLRRESGLPA